MELGYVVLYVPDVPAAVAFYERAFGLSVRSADPNGKYTEMNTGKTTLVFAAESLMEEAGHTFRAHRPLERPAASEVGFVANDVPAAYAAAIEAGAAPYEAPRTRPNGQVVAYVRDLNGVLVEICTAVRGTPEETRRLALGG
jgi:catechol 2,3-dioxygenase-like lactoylglutathione lyase family enzyme